MTDEITKKQTARDIQDHIIELYNTNTKQEGVFNKTLILWQKKLIDKLILENNQMRTVLITQNKN